MFDVRSVVWTGTQLGHIEIEGKQLLLEKLMRMAAAKTFSGEQKRLGKIFSDQQQIMQHADNGAAFLMPFQQNLDQFGRRRAVRIGWL